MRRWLADLLTGARIVAAPLLMLSLWSGETRTALLLVAVAAATDLIDGWVARRTNSASERGRWFDHVADIIFLLAGFVALALIGAVSAVAPAAITAAFSFYVVDSLRQSKTRSLVASRLGHMAGVMNYVVLGTVVFSLATDGTIVPSWLTTIAVGSVPLYSGAAVVARLAGPREQGS